MSTTASKDELKALAAANNVDGTGSAPALEKRLREAGVKLPGDEQQAASQQQTEKASEDAERFRVANEKRAAETAAAADDDKIVAGQTPDTPITPPPAAVTPPAPTASNEAPDASSDQSAESTLATHDTEDLVRLNELINKVVQERQGQAPSQDASALSDLETAKGLPILGSDQHDVTGSQVADAVDLPDGVDVLNFYVRQSVGPSGPSGDRWLVVIDTAGGKHASQLS